MTADPRDLARTFDEVAELYDRLRPTYPEPLFDDLVALGRLGPGARVVEIGCGTGQATRPLAARDLQVTCVEIGASLASVARQRLAGSSGVEVVTADFETWEPSQPPFDAVVAFTAIHWIAPETRYAKAAALLRPGGIIGIVATHHVLSPDGDQFFAEVQEDYEAVLPDDPKTREGGPVDPDKVADLTDEIAASGLFRPVHVNRYLWDVVYDADEYVGLLETYSNHRALDCATRAQLLEQIHRRAMSRPDGRVRKTYLAILHVAGVR